MRELMTWDGCSGQGRWVKRFNGRAYRVGVRKLRKEFPELTTDASRQGTVRAANTWWCNKERELERNSHAGELATIRVLKELFLSHRSTAVNVHDATLTRLLDQSLIVLQQMEDDPSQLQGIRLKEDSQGDTLADRFEVSAAESDPIDRYRFRLRRMLWEELLPLASALKVSPEVPQSAEPVEDRTVSTLVKRYMDSRLPETQPLNGRCQLSSGQFTLLKGALKLFCDFAGPQTPIDSVTADTLSRYHAQLMKDIHAETIAPETARKRFTCLRQWLRWCEEQEIIDRPPRNIDSRRLHFPKEHAEVKVFDLDALRNIYTNSNDRLKLFLCLMMNAGLRQSDIASLRVEQIQNGYLTHSRIKTQKKAPPVVRYLLWSETQQLLNSHLAAERKRRKMKPQSLLFQTPEGLPIVRRWLEGDRQKMSDVIKNAYDRILKKLKIPKREQLPLGTLRATSANLIRKEYGLELQELFLGHKSNNVATQHYTSTHNDTRLDEPLRWLEKQYAL